ncbi:MAG: ferrochelatase, partial [candidate division Zixibacteria bacterium]|nr:ferrochelatase [candidate division Zixibacteria bacterium]
AVILLAMGGPNSPDDVRRYLLSIFSDRSIIRLPGGRLGQTLLARLISSRRSAKVRRHYGMIGGDSPLLKWTQTQAANIEQTLRNDFPGTRCLVGMRYFDPDISSAIEQALSEGYRRLCFLPMYPQYSRVTTGSAFTVVHDTLGRHSNATKLLVDDFYDHPGYVQLLKEYIDANIGPNDTLLFTAHSLPKTFVDEGDPYVDQTKRTASLAAGERPFHLSFQSRSGPMEWVGPETVSEVGRLLREFDNDLFIVPISFVCDHIETLYEIDIELKQLIPESDRSRIKRMPMFNDDQRFGSVLADIVRQKVGASVSS